ncbi:MAG: polyprenyl synthetase family protein [Butyrivibrio sp.]
MDFQKMLSDRTGEAEAVIRKYMPKPGKFNERLVEAMNYSLTAGGKRLRPVLMMSFYRLMGGKGQVAEPFMAAMEMLHNYSLVHDDLPAIDNDDYRRGRPTTHRQYDEPAAILAGDGLLHQAYETAIKAFDFKDENVGNIITALRIFGDCTGINGMLGGQAADVFNTGRDISDEMMYYIYDKKTGALIEGSMMIGAALAGAGSDALSKIKQIGSDIGTAFQIRDDILDIYGDEAVTGKPALSDERNNKKTYVTVNGRDKSQKDIDNLSDKAVGALVTLDGDSEEREFLTGLFEYLTKRNK